MKVIKMPPQPPMPNFTPAEVDALEYAGVLEASCMEYREGEPIFQRDTLGHRWRIVWGQEGAWRKRPFSGY